MGGSSSKDLGQLELYAEHLQACFNTHSHTLMTIEESIQTQKLAVDQLNQHESSKHTHDADEQEEVGRNNMYDRTIISNIQSVLMLQCNVAKTNFKHLQQCLNETIEKVNETKSLSPKWTQLMDELYHSDYLTQPTATASGSALSKFSAENVGKVFEKVENLQKWQTEKENDFQLNKTYELDRQYKDLLIAKDVEIKNAKKDINIKETEIWQLEGDLKRKECEYQVLLRSLNKEREDSSYFKQQVGELQRDKQLLEEKIQRLEEKMRFKPKVPLQLYYLRNDELMMTVVQELRSMLNTQCSSLHGFEVDIQSRTQANDIQPNIPVLALCINASRLRTDAASAIHGLKSTNQIAMLIFHHKDVHAIPSQRSERMLTGQEFKELGGIIDIVFLRGKGIYSCDLNNEAMRSITRFIKGRMGGWGSKDLKQYDHIAHSLQECVSDHDNNLKVIEETVKAQQPALDVLIKYEGRHPIEAEEYRKHTVDAEGRQQDDVAVGLQQYGRKDGSQQYGRTYGSQQYGRTDGSQQYGRTDGSQPHGHSDGSQQYGRADGSQQYGRADSIQQYGRTYDRQQYGVTEDKQHTTYDGDENQTHIDENEVLRDRQHLANIQGILLLQCDIAKTNFKHLKHCLFDCIEEVVETKNLTPGWKNLADKLYLSYTQPEYNVPPQKHSRPETQLHVYSTESINEQIDILREEMYSQYRKVAEYQSKVKQKHLTEKDQKTFAAKDEETQRLKAEVTSYKCRISKQKGELQEASRKTSQLNDNISDLTRQLSESRETNRSLERQLQDSGKKVKQKVPIQLYYLRNDDLMTTVVHELKAMLSTQSSLLDFELEIRDCKQATDLKPDIPVLALCINASKLGTDAANAINGLRSSDQIALLIFHHKNVHAIPSQRSERMLTGQEFKELGGIVDLVFLRGKGIYSCDLNCDALCSITRFIKK